MITRSECETDLLAGAPPLVTVIVRTMGRTELTEALASIARQTYPNVEVVAVDARGTGELGLGDQCGRFPLRVIGSGGRLLRAAAANAGLDAARGRFVTFLDEDDFIDPTHIENLARALLSHPQFLASYSGLRVYNERGVVAWIYHVYYSREHLMKRNYLNPQVVLLSRELLDKGCRFDERFNILEDWDFSLQVSQHTAFLRVDSVTGNWRAWLGQSGAGAAGNYDAAKFAEAEQLLKKKWADTAARLKAEINALLREGVALHAASNWAEAQAVFRQVLARNPYDASGLCLSGMVELHFGRIESAIELMESAVACAAALHEAAPALHYNLGMALEAAGRIDDARREYSNALSLDPAFERARARLLEQANHEP